MTLERAVYIASGPYAKHKGFTLREWFLAHEIVQQNRDKIKEAYPFRSSEYVQK